MLLDVFQKDSYFELSYWSKNSFETEIDKHCEFLYFLNNKKS